MGLERATEGIETLSFKLGIHEKGLTFYSLNPSPMVLRLTNDTEFGTPGMPSAKCILIQV